MLLYFFRKKIAFCNYCGLYTILGLYAVTFVRMALPFEFGFTNTISDHNVYASIMNVLTPDSVAVVEVATPDSSALESGADSTSVQPIADVIYKKWRRGSHGQLQYRRWNDTKQEWVDDEWIDYKG